MYHIIKTGAPGEIRTPDPLVRSQILYPTELRAHIYMFMAEREGFTRDLPSHSPFGLLASSHFKSAVLLI